MRDLSLAARYATNLAIVNQGTVVNPGRQWDIFREAVLERVFELRCTVMANSDSMRDALRRQQCLRMPVGTSYLIRAI